jgi:AbrB family looped-hinge helix DNA binding protein
MVIMEKITKTKLQERGQITIPAKARASMGLQPGAELIVIVMENEIIIKPEIKNPVEKAGMLGKEEGVRTVKELIARYKRFK